MTYLFPEKASRRFRRTWNSFYEIVTSFAETQNNAQAFYAERIIDILQNRSSQTEGLFNRFYLFETDKMWSMLVTLVEKFSFNDNWNARYEIGRTIKETLKQSSSIFCPTTLGSSSDSGRNAVLKRATIHLLDFVLIEMGRLPSVRTDNYPLNMIDPIVPYMLLFVTSSDTTITNKAVSILHSVTSIPPNECLPALCSVDTVALQADIDLRGPRVWGKSPINMAAASTLLGHLSALFPDSDVSSPCVETVKLLVRIASSLLTSEEALHNMANCLPLTLLVTALTAAPPSHHVQIFTMYLEFFASCEIYIEIQEPFMKRLLALLPHNAHSNDPILVALSKIVTRLTSSSSLWHTLLKCLSRPEPSNTLALSLLAVINIGLKETPTLIVPSQIVPRIAQLLLQDLDELALSFLLSLLSQNSDSANRDGLEKDEAQQIVDRLLEIEQRHPLHTDTQETEKTTTDGMTQTPHVDGNGEPTSSTRTGTGVNELVDVWRVMRMAVSSLAGSPSGLERLHVLYPLILQRLKERGNALLSKDERVEQTRETLLLALVRVCSELTPLLRTVDCFPLVHLVSSFLNLIPQPTNRPTQQSCRPGFIKLPASYVRVKEFFLRVDVVTHGLDGYDITHHTIFPPSSAEHSSAGADCMISRPVSLLEFFVDFEVKCIGVKDAALLQQNNTTTPDQTRRQLLLHLLSALKRMNDFDPSAVCGVLKSFPGVPLGTSQLIDSLMDTVIVARNPSPPVCAKETCCLMSVFLLRAFPNETDSEERWRVVLREEGWEDMLNVILKQSLSDLGMKIGMNCTVASFVFEPSTIPGFTTPALLPPLNWDGALFQSPSEKSVVYHSLVSLIQPDFVFTDDFVKKAVLLLEQLRFSNSTDTNKFICPAMESTDQNLMEFLQSFMILLSSANHTLITATMKMLDSLLHNTSTRMHLRLINADLIVHLLTSLNPLSLSIADTQDIHSSVISIITLSLCLSNPYVLNALNIKDSSEQQAIHEAILNRVLVPTEAYIRYLCTNYSFIADGASSEQFTYLLTRPLETSQLSQPALTFVLDLPITLTIPSFLSFFEDNLTTLRFFFEFSRIVKELNRKDGEQSQTGQIIIRSLQKEGLEDVLQQQLQYTNTSFNAQAIVRYSVELNNLRGLNVSEYS
ncbi:hypothetical protein BLNAU_19858 [Blattamonas nauphoetae]|uniref:Uncharacterized protein n=1 Tax=Blattamonas nauphoetae TaxID=2049346 RepID=A0ABQ9X0C3_9EUKA|nr:hypothetical protein BLNAU_19858 [Blattamonas nauphoetae]